ncbi:hypothetical protein ABKPCSM17A_00026 [Acinetobacter baumannii]|nr:hypothetical protein ABKPCSM17A_00026 [Acinetobacter baumannii]
MKQYLFDLVVGLFYGVIFILVLLGVSRLVQA